MYLFSLEFQLRVIPFLIITYKLARCGRQLGNVQLFRGNTMDCNYVRCTNCKPCSDWDVSCPTIGQPPVFKDQHCDNYRVFHGESEFIVIRIWDFDRMTFCLMMGSSWQ